MNPNPDFYTTVKGDFGDDIEGWANSVGLTLDFALEVGVCSPEEGDAQEVYVPNDLIEALKDPEYVKAVKEV